MKVVYAVVTQFEPTHKYEEAFESFWTTERAAIAEAHLRKMVDWVIVRPIPLDGAEANYSDIVVKSPRMAR